MRIWRPIFLFCLGGSAYFVIELLWRGRSHGSMFALGGLCFLLLGQLLRRFERIPLALKLVLSSVLITALELLTGLFVNQNFAVWDYRAMPYNYLGQICLNYSLLWIPVSLMAMQLYEKVQKRLP